MKIIRQIVVMLIFCIIITSMSNFAYAKDRVSMTYLYRGTAKDYKAQIAKTNGTVDVVLPNLFNIKSDGSIDINNVIDRQFIEDMHKKGIKVIPYISNHFDRELGRKALSNYVAYCDAVAAVVKEYNLDGVNIDIENLTAGDGSSGQNASYDKENFVQFTKYLRSVLPVGKELSMAIAANPNDIKTDWPGSYDYEELNKYVDNFIIMTYDQSYPGSKPGPVAGYIFVEKSIKTMLKYVPSQKIVLGIPFYGRYWNDREARGGEAVVMRVIDSIKLTFGAQEYYDTYNRTPYINFSVGRLGSTYSFSGKKFSIGNYIMYYENERSLKEKLILVEKYNLKGSASWALSQEDASIWDNFKNWLNGIYYHDTKYSWAKDEIREATVRGYMTGTDINNFNPQSYITREEFATVLSRVFGYSTVIVNKPVFQDVKVSNWAYNYINTIYSYGLMKGYGGYFRPKDYITREEVAVSLYRALNGYAVKNQKYFYDLSEDRWSKQYIDFCVQRGILNGFPDGSFKPYKEITREEIAKILVNLK